MVRQTKQFLQKNFAPFHYPRQSLRNFQVACNSGFAMKIQGNFEQ